MACARAPEAMAALGPREGVEARLRLRLRPAARRHRGGRSRANAPTTRSISACCARSADANRAWGTATGLQRCDALAAWLARDGAERAATPGRSCRDRAHQDAAIRARSRPGCSRPQPDYEALAARLAECCAPAARHAAARRAGRGARRGAARRARASPCAYADAKRGRGRGRFRRSDPRGRGAAADARHGRLGALQARPADRPYPGRRGAGHQRAAVEHRPRAGAANISPARARRGGTGRSSPSATTSRRSSASRAPIPRASTSPAPGSRERPPAVERDFLDLSMDRSFRSSPPILEVVDRVIDDLGHEALRPAAPAQPAREPSCEAAGLGDLVVPLHRRSRRRRGCGRGGLDQRRRPAATPRGSRGR